VVGVNGTGDQIRELLRDFVREDPRNKLTKGEDITIFDPPLVGLASAQDPLYQQLKVPDVVGPNHLLPEEWLQGAKTVISYFWPFSEKVRKSNRGLGLPSEEWVYARIDGEAFNHVVRKFMKGQGRRLWGLAQIGLRGISPI